MAVHQEPTRNQGNEIKELQELNPIKRETRTQYLTDLYKKEKHIIEWNTPEITTNGVIKRGISP